MKTKLFLILFLALLVKPAFSQQGQELEFHYEGNSIFINSKNGNFEAKIENTRDGMYQISRDRTRMIVFTETEDVKPYYNSVYYIDSVRKIKKLLMKNWQNAMSDSNVKFLLCQKERSNPLNFILLDLENNKAVPVTLKIRDGKIIETCWLCVEMYRSEDAKFDYVIDLAFDAFIAAEYGFSIKSKKFTEIFDETKKEQSFYREAETRSKFELGR